MANPPTLQDLIKILEEKYTKPNKAFVALLRQLFSRGKKAMRLSAILCAAPKNFSMNS